MTNQTNSFAIEKLDKDIQQKNITFSSHNQPNNKAKQRENHSHAQHKS